MKRILTILICAALMCSLTGCGGSASKQAGSVNTAEPQAVETSVPESTEEPSVPAPDGPWVPVISRTNSYLSSEFLYDADGRIIKEVTTNTKTARTFTYEYTYTQQSDGTVLARRMDPEDDMYGRDFIYDADGRCVEYIYYVRSSGAPEELFTEKSIASRTTYEYNEAEMLLVSKCMNQKDGYSGTGTVIEYVYDENNRLTSKTEKSYPEDKVLNASNLTYDAEGNVVKNDQKSASFGDYLYEYICKNEFDAKGLLISSEICPTDHGSFQKTTYEYSDDDMLISKTYQNGCGIMPVEYFLGEGYLMESFEAETITFKPLSLVLEQQDAE